MAIHSLQVEDARGRSLSLDLLSRGLTVHRLLVQRPGFPPRDLICAPEHSSQYDQEGRRFKNQVVGRYTNRLLAGRSSIETPERLQLELNLEPNENAKNCLHSGSNGYDTRDFQPISPTSAIVQSFQESHGTPDDQPEQQTSFFHLYSPAGDQGFPEAIDILGTVSLTAPHENLPNHALAPSHSLLGRLTFTLRARIRDSLDNQDQPCPRGTPINLTWHIGYILNNFDKLHGDRNGINEHKLGINADHYVETDQDQLATGKIKKTTDVGFNLSSGDLLTGDGVEVIGKHIPKAGFGEASDFGSNIAHFLLHSLRVESKCSAFHAVSCLLVRARKDHCLIFQDPGNIDQPKVTLRSPTNDLVLNFRTNQTAVQCYSSNFFDGTGFRKDLHQNDTHPKGYGQKEALYLEFQQPIGICQNPKMQQELELQHGGNTSSILYPGEVYLNWFTIDVYVEEN